MPRERRSRHNGAMHWEVVEGVRIPKRVGGDVALDLCNTLAGWAEPSSRRSEWLPHYDALALWSERAGLLSHPH